MQEPCGVAEPQASDSLIAGICVRFGRLYTAQLEGGRLYTAHFGALWELLVRHTAGAVGCIKHLAAFQVASSICTCWNHTNSVFGVRVCCVWLCVWCDLR